MEQIDINEYTKVLVPAANYDLDTDKRLLIPFTSGEKIGFINRNKEIVVKPQYCMYYGECFSEEDYIRVAVNYPYGFANKSGTVSAYQRPLYGLINYKGEVVIPVEYFSLVPAIGNKRVYTLQNKEYQYGVIDLDGTEIVPFGKYNWIDGFDKGLARVKIGTATNGLKDSGNKWGAIDETGKEILPVEYDDIWNFYGKNRLSTKVVKGGVSREMFFTNLIPSLSTGGASSLSDTHADYDDEDYGTSYGDFAGTYAQDVEGYSDDVIYDAFEGDPDAYWNID